MTAVETPNVTEPTTQVESELPSVADLMKQHLVRGNATVRVPRALLEILQNVAIKRGEQNRVFAVETFLTEAIETWLNDAGEGGALDDFVRGELHTVQRRGEAESEQFARERELRQRHAERQARVDEQHQKMLGQIARREPKSPWCSHCGTSMRQPTRDEIKHLETALTQHVRYFKCLNPKCSALLDESRICRTDMVR